MKIIDKVALVLIIIGAINWGLIGFFKFDLVAAIFGQMSAFSRIIYALWPVSSILMKSLSSKNIDVFIPSSSIIMSISLKFSR